MAQQIYIPRRLESVITEAAKYFSVISVTGPRQSGKSTMLKQLFPDLPKYSMKDLHVRAFAEQARPCGILESAQRRNVYR